MIKFVCFLLCVSFVNCHYYSEYILVKNIFQFFLLDYMKFFVHRWWIWKLCQRQNCRRSVDWYKISTLPGNFKINSIKFDSHVIIFSDSIVPWTIILGSNSNGRRSGMWWIDYHRILYTHGCSLLRVSRIWH